MGLEIEIFIVVTGHSRARVRLWVAWSICRVVDKCVCN
jgi:hypothetical protein